MDLDEAYGLAFDVLMAEKAVEKYAIKDKEGHLHDESDGRFVSKDSGPSIPNKTRRANITLPEHDWIDPPAPMGKKGGGPPKRGSGADSQTKLGDHAEELTAKLNLRSILPPGQRHGGVGFLKKHGMSTLDREYDHSGYAFEVKVCRVTATEYRAKPKPDEIAGKLKYSKKHKLKPMTMIAVYDAENGEMYCYVHPGITSKGLPLGPDKGDWKFFGKVSF